MKKNFYDIIYTVYKGTLNFNKPVYFGLRNLGLISTPGV